MRKGIIENYKDFLPLSNNTPRITLGEGNTPLLYGEKLSERVGAHVYLKYEGLNPSGSFKDRGMVMAVAKALEENSKAIICASTGNTSASAAAYGAKSGLKTVILIPEGKIAMGKLAQAQMYGGKVISISGNFDQALELVKSLSEDYPMTLVNSVNPYRIEGQKTAAFEICDELGDSPDYLSIPVGNAGNITAYWKGFQEYFDRSMTSKKPRLLGFQAEGASPIVHDRIFRNPETIATAIRIGNPASWDKANKALLESKGQIAAVTDEEITDAYQFLAKEEGIFVEPASAASVAGLLKTKDQLALTGSEKIVCVNTGNGLKDPLYAIETMNQKIRPVPPEKSEILKILGFGGA